MKSAKALMLILFMAVSARAQFPNFTPPTALLGAAARNETAAVDRLLSAGADPNEAKLAGFSPIFFPIFNENIDMFRKMVQSGADVKVTDPAGGTTLMWAAANEHEVTDFVNELIKLGVDVNAKNKDGDTALTWALRRGDTPIVAALRKAGATEDRTRASVERAIVLLQKSGPGFTKGSGCVSCHNQSLPQMAVSAARKSGFAVDAQTSADQVKAVVSLFAPAREMMLQEPERIPDVPVTVSYTLLGLSAEGYAADATTEAMATTIARHQAADGHFRTFTVRPPLESSDFTGTALSIRALQIYGKDTEKPIAMARQWLESAKPRTHEDAAMRLLGLSWSKAEQARLKEAAAAIIATQRPDGGWAQLPGLETDAYATGQALVALRNSGQLQTTDPVYRRGIDYLLRTQMQDGSWFVRSRTFPFQPYRESGFPHGKDQFISAAGTSWAVLALSQGIPVLRTE
jgi:ankyrin repeat protein/squalene-hopene cyclase-like protein